MDLLTEIVPEDGFKAVESLKAGPVSKEVLLQNIKDSVDVDAPLFKSDKDNKKEGSFIFVAGGPTLLDYLDVVKERADNGEFICTSNLTYDFLIDNDIVPNACLVIDPKERVKDYIKKPSNSTVFYIGTVCDPRVGKGLVDAGMNVRKLLVAYGSEDGADIDMQQEVYDSKEYVDFLVGGTMAGLRAMPFSIMLGYRKIEYYGFDSCFSSKPPNMVYENDPDYERLKAEIGQSYEDADTGENYVLKDVSESGFFYAYSKKRGENIQIARTSDLRRFVTSPCFSHQAIQLIKWVERLEGHLDVEIHGDSLSSHYLKCYRESIAKALITIGDKRWTSSYGDLQKELHSRGGYGKGEHINMETIGRQIVALYSRLNRPLRILDYGSAKGKLKTEIESVFNIAEVVNYDPFVDEFSTESTGTFDIVYCFDVMEHVERQCVPNVLKYIKERADFLVYFIIHTSDAKKELADGRNAHVTQKQASWWADEVQTHFVIGEAMADPSTCYFVCQPEDVKKRFDREGK